MRGDARKRVQECTEPGPCGPAEAGCVSPLCEPPEQAVDVVNHPPHYTSHPSGVECIQVTEHMGFNLGNAVKYVWRADLKNDALEDLQKAAWYIEREIQRRGGES
jgi:hypothetical protein